MNQNKHYGRGVEDAQEFIARLLEKTGEGPALAQFQALAAFVRTLGPETIRSAMSADDAWMREVAERELERTRTGWRARTAAYEERMRRRAAGEEVSPLPRGPRRVSST